MWFSKKSPEEEDGLVIPSHILPTMQSGFLLVDCSGDNHILTAEFTRLLGISREVASLSQLMTQLDYEVARQLTSMINALKKGEQAEARLVSLGEGGACLSAHLLQNASQDMHGAVIWAYDVSAVLRETKKTSVENTKLKADVSRYATMLNAAPYPIWEHDAQMKIRYCNVRYSELSEDTPGKQSVDAIPELDKRQTQLASAALKEGKPKDERRHLIVNGERKLYQFHEYPLADQQMVVGFGQDISEIDELYEEIQRYRSAQADLLESSASAMAIYGRDMRLKSFNYAFVNLWKLDEAWLDTEPTYAEILENLREKRKLPEQANFQMFKQQQLKLFTDLIEPREEFFYLPDGKTLRVIAITHALGGILFAYEDVTDRLALERSYNTLIAVQRETLDNLHEGVAVFAEDGRLKLFNPVYLKMWNISEDMARSEPHARDLIAYVRDLYIFDDWDSFAEQRVSQLQSRTTLTYRIERRDGKVFNCSTVPLPDGATLITYIDVTDTTLVERSLRERNEALQEADRLKTEFLANVSYELRSPLTSISGFSDMLVHEYFGKLNEKQVEYVDGIRRSAQHLMQLVNDILDLASIEAGYMQLDIAKFDISAMLKSVMGLVQERAKQQSITLRLDCQPRIGKMEGDEARIKQIFFNLLSNAVRFSEQGSEVALGAKAEEDKIIFWVSDQGPGIPEIEQPFVFNKFYKGKNQAIPKAKSKGGTGLGLSIVKNFVDLHGGSISLESQPGATRFTCVLPRQAKES